MMMNSMSKEAENVRNWMLADVEELKYKFEHKVMNSQEFCMTQDERQQVCDSLYEAFMSLEFHLYKLK